MRIAVYGFLFLLVMLLPGNASAQAPQNQTETNSSIKSTVDSIPFWQTRQTTFGIPFSISPSATLPEEVHLLVSGDQGASWQLYNRVKPNAKRFAFRVARDGEYWFAVRTVMKRNQVNYEPPRQAELRVVVDTKPPRLDFSAKAGPAGEIEAAWNIDDQHLQGESLKIEYQAAPDKPWQPVSVALPREKSPKSLSGTMSWWPKTSARVVQVRATIYDSAGNTASVNRRVTLPPPSKPPTQFSKNDPPVRPVDPFTKREQPPNTTDTTWPADNITNRPPTDFRAGPTDSEQRRLATNPPESPRTDKVIGHRRDLTPNTQQNAIPPNVKPRITRQKRFNLSYSVEEADRRDLTQVELWITRDGGRIWNRHSVDDDLQSPLSVELTEDGTNGFRIVLVGRNGFLGDPPRAGDSADIWVTSDTTAPHAKITSAIYGKGQQTGKLDIHWEVADRNLIQRPVTLLYSAGPNGPWTTIASDLPNTGRFLWQMESNVPREVYLLLSVLDIAGNEGSDRLEQPVRLQGLAPKGKILDLLPPDDLRRGALRERRFR